MIRPVESSMLKDRVQITDQHGAQRTVAVCYEAAAIRVQSPLDCIQYIDVDGEQIRPSFDLHFYSEMNGKIYRLS